jgi:hypothetical protein
MLLVQPQKTCIHELAPAYATTAPSDAPYTAPASNWNTAPGTRSTTSVTLTNMNTGSRSLRSQHHGLHASSAEHKLRAAPFCDTPRSAPACHQRLVSALKAIHGGKMEQEGHSCHTAERAQSATQPCTQAPRLAASYCWRRFSRLMSICSSCGGMSTVARTLRAGAVRPHPTIH